MNRIARQDVTFGMTVPESGTASMSTVLVFRTPDGLTRRFTALGQLLGVVAGPITVTVETMLTVAEPPPPTLREQLVERLGDTQSHGVRGQAAAVLELLSERPNLLAELEALLDDDDDDD